MSDTKNSKKSSGLFFVWKNYQRRPEVLASLLNCELQFIPHLFQSKYLRPLDYLIKLIISLKEILLRKPDFIIAQCPPTYSALAGLMTRTPYIIDAHNPLFQVKMWQTLPFAQTILNNASGIIVHNAEMYQLVKTTYPSANLFTISDPIKAIAPTPRPQRIARQILVIASFDPWDEPVDLLIDTMARLQEYNFVITASASKLEPETAKRLQSLSNVRMTGFLAVEEYHNVLCSSQAALVLTTSEATQPSGACEALSSDTQLIISKTSLTQELFGDWAILVDNFPESIVEAIKNSAVQDLELESYRDKWNSLVNMEISRLLRFVSKG